MEPSVTYLGIRQILSGWSGVRYLGSLSPARGLPRRRLSARAPLPLRSQLPLRLLTLDGELLHTLRVSCSQSLGGAHGILQRSLEASNARRRGRPGSLEREQRGVQPLLGLVRGG